MENHQPLGIESVNKIAVSLSLVGQFWGTPYVIFRLSPLRPNSCCSALLSLLASLSYFPTFSFFYLCAGIVCTQVLASMSLSLSAFFHVLIFLLILDSMIQDYIHFLDYVLNSLALPSLCHIGLNKPWPLFSFNLRLLFIPFSDLLWQIWKNI